MVDRLITEIESALSHELYMAALTMTLMLPDVCGKAAYPDLPVGRRYKKWYDDNIGQFERPTECEEPAPPYLDGNMVYRLRCAFLHEGNPDAAKENSSLDKFELIVEREKPFHIYTGEAGSLRWDSTGWSCRTYRVNVQRLCRAVCAVVKSYYKENRDKFNFFTYTIVDMDEEKERMRQMGFMQEIDLNDIFQQLAKTDSGKDQ